MLTGLFTENAVDMIHINKYKKSAKYIFELNSLNIRSLVLYFSIAMKINVVKSATLHKLALVTQKGSLSLRGLKNKGTMQIIINI